MDTIRNYAYVTMMAVVPVGELRMSIPVGIAVYDLSVFWTYVFSVLGNMLPVVLVFGIGDAWVRFVTKRQGWMERVTKAVIERSRRKLSGEIETWGAVAVAIFIAIPLPLTGAWTGMIAAYALGIPFRKAALAALAGVMSAGVIVTLAVTGVVKGFQIFLG